MRNREELTVRKELLLLCAAALALSSCDFSTKGDKIGTYKNPKRALLVLDVQKDFTSDSARMPIDRSQVVPLIRNINSLITDSQGKGDLVIYIRNVFHRPDVANLFRHYAAIEGSPGVAFDDRLLMVSDRVFDKSQPDAFSNKGLESFLVANQVGEITVCGVFADQCVYWTSRGALSRGYNVNYAVDAVGAGSARDISRAAASIEKYGARLVTSKN